MSLESKSSKSRRRADFGNQITPSVGFRKLLALHQMSSGQTDINLAALSIPSNLNFPFQNPSTADLLSANISFFKNNVTVKRSDGGELIQGLEFGVISNSVIRLASPAQGNTVVQITIDLAPVSPVNVAGGSPITASSVLAVGQTQVNTGVPFQTGLFASTGNIGAVMVFRNRQLLKRNTANSSSNLDQDYYELNTGLGVGTLIVLNRTGELLPGGDQEQIDIVSVGILLQAPTASMMAFFDSFGAQLDKIQQVLSDVSGLPLTAFAANPNQVDLRSFGDLVTAQGVSIASLLAQPVSAIYNTSSTVLTGSYGIVDFSNLEEDTHNNVVTGASWRFTCTIPGLYAVSAATISGSGGATAMTLFKNGSNYAFLGIAAGNQNASTRFLRLVAGDYLDIRELQLSGGTLDGTATNNWVSIVKVGN